MTEVDYKSKYKKLQNRFNKMKPYADTMARHNDRLQNEINAIKPVLESFRKTIKELCPHKTDWIDPSRQTQWGEEVKHYCDKCKSFISTEDIERTI